jgi:hypothetical protein
MVAGKSPTDFDARREMCGEARDGESYEADERSLDELHRAQAEAPFVEVAVDTLHELVAFDLAQGARQELGHLRIRIEPEKRHTIVFSPATQNESPSPQHDAPRHAGH